LGNFTNWKIYCSEQGIVSTKNALESFNNLIKSVIIDHLFKYKGNAKITKRQRGRVRDALPALQIM
jgi:hypothetical protein